MAKLIYGLGKLIYGQVELIQAIPSLFDYNFNHVRTYPSSISLTLRILVLKAMYLGLAMRRVKKLTHNTHSKTNVKSSYSEMYWTRYIQLNLYLRRPYIDNMIEKGESPLH